MSARPSISGLSLNVFDIGAGYSMEWDFEGRIARDADIARAGKGGEKKKWLGPGSNRGHEDFQSSALPTELPSPKRERLICTSGWRTQDVFCGN